ncbi:MAG: membrane protein insertase YidC [Lysobacterales bacterium]
MGNLRPVLIVGLLFLAYMIWVQWQRDYGPAPQSAPAAQTASQTAGAASAVPGQADGVPAADLPSPPEQAAVPHTSAPAEADLPGGQAVGPTGQPRIRVTTDVLELAIDPVGGTVVSATLLHYPVDLDQPEEKVSLMVPEGPGMFIAQSGLLSRQPAPNHTTEFRSPRKEYVLQDGADRLEVPLTWVSEDGVEVTKTLVLSRGQYEIDVNYRLRNGSGETWVGSRYDQLQRSVPEDEDSAGFTNPERYSFFGVGFYNPENKFEKINFDDLGDEPYEVTTRSGWLAMIQHYFFAAWIPPADEEATFSTQLIKTGSWPRFIARNVSPASQAAPGEELEFSSRLYLGPKLQDNLPDIAPGLEYTVNYGIFTVFSKPLFWLLEKIHDVVGNWGWAIVILTILIKAAFFKLTEAQYRSTARMRKLQPRIEALKERYGDDRQRMSQAMMEMYKKEKVNPLGGCLPILVQIPIFIALYWVLLESVELRQAPFILWIDNLSVRDPYFVLPLLNAAFMFATQRLTPMVGMDPLQQKMMTMMPIVFSIMFAFFPAGLVLYWATNAGLSLAQQYYITRKIAAAD